MSHLRCEELIRLHASLDRWRRAKSRTNDKSHSPAAGRGQHRQRETRLENMRSVRLWNPRQRGPVELQWPHLRFAVTEAMDDFDPTVLTQQ